MYLVELIRPCKRTIGPGPLVLIMPQTKTEPPPPCSVETEHLGLNYSSFLRRTYCLPSLPSLLNLLSSLKSTFDQYEESWSSLDLTKSRRRFLFFTEIIGLRLATYPRKLNSFNLFLTVEREHFFNKIALLLDLGSRFKSVSKAADLDSIVFPVRSNSGTTRFRGITNTVGALVLLHSLSYRFSHYISICNQFPDWITQKGGD